MDHERKPTEDFFRYEVLTIESKEQEVIDLTLFSSNDSLEVDVILDFLIDGKLKSRELKKKVFITPLGRFLQMSDIGGFTWMVGNLISLNQMKI
ncbi:MAG: hypothetical protein V8S24_07890 [Gordonibacter pamelaeae]